MTSEITTAQRIELLKLAERLTKDYVDENDPSLADRMDEFWRTFDELVAALSDIRSSDTETETSAASADHDPSLSSSESS